MPTPHGPTGVLLTRFARPMILDPSLRTLTVPLLFWESITRRAAGADSTMPGGPVTRPSVGDPLVFEVRKSLEMMNAIIDVSIGRTPNNDIVIDDGSVSRFHAVLKHDERSGEWSLADANSSNGTFVRGERLKPETPFVLFDDEPIVFGSVSARFLTPAGFFRYLDAMK